MMQHFWRFRVVVTTLLTVIAVLALADPALAVRARPNTHRGWVKYYIVKPPHDGLQEYLYEIAQHTLGSGKYAVQIFDLNKGRLEPGGDRMLSASVIKPGWILVLPQNAHGPGVRYGPLPAVTVTPAPTATASASPAASPRPTASASLTTRSGQLTTIGPSSGRKLILQAAIGGALIMALLTTGLFVFDRKRTPAANPKNPRKPFIRRKLRGGPVERQKGQRRQVVWLDEPPAGPAAAKDISPAGGTAPDVPSWLGVAGPLDDPYQPATSGARVGSAPADGQTLVDWPRPNGTAPADQAEPGDEGTAWPGFLGKAGDDEPTITSGETAGQPKDRRYIEPPGATRPTGPPDAPRLTDPPARNREAEDSAFSPAALRILGARPSRQRDDDDMPAQRHQVALGDDRIEVVLAEAPAASRVSRARTGKTWLAAAPYLVWAPLPYDVPDDGLAFACIGAGDEGCLFLDLAAAPGAIAIDGDPGADVRLAESLAHQLCAGAKPGEVTNVVLVGDAVPEPHPAGATWVATPRDLATADPDGPLDRTDIVFCELSSSEDAFVLARHVTSAPRRIIPIVLGRLPGAAWSLTARSSPRADLTLPTLVAARPASRQ